MYREVQTSKKAQQSRWTAPVAARARGYHILARPLQVQTVDSKSSASVLAWNVRRLLMGSLQSESRCCSTKISQLNRFSFVSCPIVKALPFNTVKYVLVWNILWECVSEIQKVTTNIIHYNSYPFPYCPFPTLSPNTDNLTSSPIYPGLKESRFQRDFPHHQIFP